MKKLRVLFFAIALFGYSSVRAQSEAATYFAKYITATKFYSGNGLPVDHEKSFKLMKECSEGGQMHEAMLRLGLMYNMGIGTEKSEKEAFKWVSESSKRGNAMAHFALGRLYKEGSGVEQDFVKAREAFQKSADAGNLQGKYMLGYMYYRGLGGEQSYEKAARYFTEADAEGNEKASYMLGVCYKNGYGVTKDPSIADSFLNKAMKRGFKNAKKEMQKKEPEVNLQRDQQFKNHALESGLTGNNVKQENLTGNLSGEWLGKQYTFDWSKEHILEEVNLRMVIEESQGNFSGDWFENDHLLFSFSGKIIDKVMLFNYVEFTSIDKFGEPAKMAFSKAKLEMLFTTKKYLAGEVETFIPKAKEPGYPMYIAVEKTKDKILEDRDSLVNKSTEIEINDVQETNEFTASPDNEILSSEISKRDAVISIIKEKEEVFKVFPNPVSQYLNIEYNLQEDSKVQLSVFNSSGTMVFIKDLTRSHIGKNSYGFEFKEVPGSYIVILTVNGQNYSKMVIKK